MEGRERGRRRGVGVGSIRLGHKFKLAYEIILKLAQMVAVNEPTV